MLHTQELHGLLAVTQQGLVGVGFSNGLHLHERAQLRDLVEVDFHVIQEVNLPLFIHYDEPWEGMRQGVQQRLCIRWSVELHSRGSGPFLVGAVIRDEMGLDGALPKLQATRRHAEVSIDLMVGAHESVWDGRETISGGRKVSASRLDFNIVRVWFGRV